MVIDSHHHFWRYTDAEYGWIPPAWSAIRRDFLPADLAAEINRAGVDGVISVQARQSLEETRWLLELASENAFIRGVVGWVPLIDPVIDSILDRLCAQPKLRAIRHVLQGEPDDYMARTDFDRGLVAVTLRGLVYDLLVLERQLPAAIALVDRHPNQIFVLDHIAKPRIAAGEIDVWARHIRELARRPNVACKLSGMVTEAEVTTWTPARLKPYFEVVLEAFGPQRLLYGTDWPVCLTGVSYGKWKETVETWIAPLSLAERTAIMGETATLIYGLR